MLWGISCKAILAGILLLPQQAQSKKSGSTHVDTWIGEVSRQGYELPAPLGIPVCVPKGALIGIRGVGHCRSGGSRTDECGVGNQAPAGIALDRWQTYIPAHQHRGNVRLQDTLRHHGAWLEVERKGRGVEAG